MDEPVRAKRGWGGLGCGELLPARAVERRQQCRAMGQHRANLAPSFSIPMLLLLLLLLLTPNEVLKKTENRILLSISGLGPSTNGKDLEKRNLENSKTQTNKKRTRMKDDTEIERCN